MRCLFIILLVVSSLGLTAKAEEPYSLTHGDLSLSYETLTLPGAESMGLLGMGLQMRLNENEAANWYGGLTVYGAMRGQRGGFFTGGLSTGLSMPVYAGLDADVGLFVGGGGGGSAPQGGGLMLRPHVGLNYRWADWRWGLQWSRVRFPNGAIDSQQWSLTLMRPLEFRLASTWLTDAAATGQKQTASFRRRHLRINQWSYFPRPGSFNSSNSFATTPMRLLGFSMDFECNTDRQLTRSYFSLQTAGALGGQSDGYAEVLWAYGWRSPLTGHLSWRLDMALGAGGGGSVATGGGLLLRSTLALEYNMGAALQAAVTLGHVAAPQGEFRASVVGLQLSYRYAVPALFDAASLSVTRPQHWRVRGAWQSYRPYGDTRRKGQSNPDDRAVELFASKIDLIVTKNVFITGQALGAYEGGAGGYAAGQFGLGWRLPLSTSWTVNSELLFGAGGGGGLNVGAGQLLQAMVGLEMDLSDRLSLMVSTGSLQAPDGPLQARVMDIALAWRFSIPVKN